MSKTPALETVVLSTSGATATLSLNRPDKLNPLSPMTLQEITIACEWLDNNDDVKVVIVNGVGRSFCAGADLTAFRQGGMARREAADWGRKMADALEGMRPIAVASIHGWCIGGGLVLAAACDLRVASENARFSIPEVDLGIGLAWGGIPRLIREIGPAMTKELVLTCREFSPQEAKAVGFLNRVVPEIALEEETEQLASTIAKKAGFPITATKRNVNAITSQVFGTDHAWSDADIVLTALADPECQAARDRYLAERRK